MKLLSTLIVEVLIESIVELLWLLGLITFTVLSVMLMFAPFFLATYNQNYWYLSVYAVYYLIGAVTLKMWRIKSPE